jgi:hypothetical protein
MVRTCRDPFVHIRGFNSGSGAALEQIIRAAVVVETILIILSLSTHSLWSVLETLVSLPPVYSIHERQPIQRLLGTLSSFRTTNICSYSNH